MILNKLWQGINILIIFFLFFSLSLQKCKNSTDFKYDLQEVSQLVGYHSLCSEFSRRTCCSTNNFDFIAKRMTKVLGGNVAISNPCRFRLTNAMCSFCDGDIGQQLKKGVCPHYCWQFYEDCKNDFFAIDNNNQLKVCKDDDIICSKLAYIVPQTQKQGICSLLDLKVDKNSCWNGQISAHLKGAARKKVNVRSSTKVRRKKQTSLWSEIVRQKHLTIPIGIVGIAICFYLLQKLRARHALWKRQLRNL